MKRLATSIMVAGLMGTCTALSQFIAPGGPGPIPIKSPPPPKGVPHPSNRPEFQGLIPQLIRMKKPWELVNPYAPPEYGTGSGNTTKDPNDPGKPKGIIVFGITW